MGSSPVLSKGQLSWDVTNEGEGAKRQKCLNIRESHLSRHSFFASHGFLVECGRRVTTEKSWPIVCRMDEWFGIHERAVVTVQWSKFFCALSVFKSNISAFFRGQCVDNLSYCYTFVIVVVVFFPFKAVYTKLVIDKHSKLPKLFLVASLGQWISLFNVAFNCSNGE